MSEETDGLVPDVEEIIRGGISGGQGCDEDCDEDWDDED